MTWLIVETWRRIGEHKKLRTLLTFAGGVRYDTFELHCRGKVQEVKGSVSLYEKNSTIALARKTKATVNSNNFATVYRIKGAP